MKASLGACLILGGLVIGGTLHWGFSTVVPEPIMDEVFHVPQAGKYCAGRLHEWDPKITTPPGLYLLAAAYGHAAHSLQPGSLGEALCSTATLRSLNVLLAAFCMVLLRQTHREIHRNAAGEDERDDSALMAAAATLLPLHFFFAFLFYTDVLSTTLVVASFLAVRRRQPGLGAVLSLAAITARQTNAVWAGFNLGVGVLDRLCPVAPSHRSHKSPLPRIADIPRLLALSWQLRLQLVREFWGLAAVLLGFAGFLKWNGGVVLGDKSNHVSVFHPTQLLYLSLFAAASLWPIHLVPSRAVAMARWLLEALRARPRTTAAACVASAAAAFACVGLFTLVHPFTLADNRHYVFYIWRKILGRHVAIRYLMVAPYLYSVLSVGHSLAAKQGSLWLLMFAVCCGATLIPAWLVEFRYFTIPMMHTMLHMEPPSHFKMWTLIGSFAAVNALTIAVFLGHTYTWPDGSEARFMW